MKKSPFISVEDELPKVDQEVLVITEDGSYVNAKYCLINDEPGEVEWGFYCEWLYETVYATHWMPIPIMLDLV